MSFYNTESKVAMQSWNFQVKLLWYPGCPKKIWAQLEPRFWKSVIETKIFPLDPWRTGMSKAQIFFLGHPGYHKSLTWKFQDCTETFDSVNSVSINDTRELGIFYHNSFSMPQ